MKDTNKKYFRPLPKNIKNKEVRVKLTEEDRQILEVSCIKYSLTMSEYIRKLIHDNK